MVALMTFMYCEMSVVTKACSFRSGKIEHYVNGYISASKDNGIPLYLNTLSIQYMLKTNESV